MNISQPSIIVITGIMASGKSTVGQLLAGRLEKSVHLRGDIFRKMIVNDRREVRPNADQLELEQLRLRYRLTAQAAETYLQAGFHVVVQDVIIGNMLGDFVSFLQNRPFYLVVLCPDPAVVSDREKKRAKKGYGDWTVGGLDEVLRSETPRIGMWLDSSRLTPEQTVDEIVANVWTKGVIS